MKKTKHIVICLFCLLLCVFTSCKIATFYPEDGEWYCEELHLQLCFDKDGECYYLFEGEKITCACGSDKGSSWLSVGCQETDSQYFALGEEVFGAEFVSLDQNVLVVYAEDKGKEYIFLRVE